VATALSVVAIALALFVLPSACSTVAGFQILFFGALLLLGLASFVLGLFLVRRGL
jgi:hypothetical protein